MIPLSVKAVKQNPNSATSDKATPSRSGPIKKENIGAQYRHHPLRARRRPPKGMHLEQGDIMSLSASQDAGVLTIRQLDTQLVSLKRQVCSHTSPSDQKCNVNTARDLVFKHFIHGLSQTLGLQLKIISLSINLAII